MDLRNLIKSSIDLKKCLTSKDLKFSLIPINKDDFIKSLHSNYLLFELYDQSKNISYYDEKLVYYSSDDDNFSYHADKLVTHSFDNFDNCELFDLKSYVKEECPRQLDELLEEEDIKERHFIYYHLYEMKEENTTYALYLISFHLPVIPFSEEQATCDCRGDKCRRSDPLLNCIAYHGNRNYHSYYRKKWPLHEILDSDDIISNTNVKSNLLNVRIEFIGTRDLLKTSFLEDEMKHLQNLEDDIKKIKQKLIDKLGIFKSFDELIAYYHNNLNH